MMLRRTAALCLAAQAPALVSLALLIATGPFHLSDYVPIYSDDVSLNHQLRTFAQVGLAGGYYTVNEVAPAFSLSHFGPHGPVYPVLAGALLRLLPSTLWAPILLNHLLIGLSLLVFLATMPFSPVRVVMASLAVATFWPLTVMLTVSMQETMHYVLAIGFATIAIKRVRPVGFWILASAVLGAGVAARSIWGLALIYILQPRDNFFRRSLALAALAITLCVAGQYAASYLAAPQSGSIAATLAPTTATTATEYVGVRIAAVSKNISCVLGRCSPQPLEMEVFALLPIVVGALAALIVRQPEYRRLLAAVGCGLVLALAAVAILYDTGQYRGFRVIGPFVLVGVLVLVTLAPRLGLIFPLVGLAFAGQLIAFHQSYRAPSFVSTAMDQVAYAERVTAAAFSYRTSSESAWCNTVLTDNPALGAAFNAVPPGIGISVMTALPDLSTHIPRSRYLWLESAEARAKASLNSHLAAVVDVPAFSIFLNKGVCD